MKKSGERNNQLIFLDIDGTLLDYRYRPNDDSLPALIEELTERGALFALNSNRAYEDMEPIAQQFRITGPLIVENGVEMYYHNKYIPLVDNLHSVKDKVKGELEKAGKLFGACVEIVDTVAFKPPEKGLCFAVNKFRRFSASIHVYRAGKIPTSKRRLQF